MIKEKSNAGWNLFIVMTIVIAKILSIIRNNKTNFLIEFIN